VTQDTGEPVCESQRESAAEDKAAPEDWGTAFQGALPEFVLPEAWPRRIGDLWCGGMLCLTVVAVTLAHSYRVVTYAHAKEFVLSAGVAISALGLLFRGGLSWRGARALLPLWFCLLVAVVLALGPLFARLPWRVVEEATRLAVLLAAALAAYDLTEQRAWRARLRMALETSAVLAAALGLVQYLRLAPHWFPVFEGNDQRVYSVFANQDLFGGYMAFGLALMFPRLLGEGKTGSRAPWRPALRLSAFSLVSVALLLSASRSAWLAAAVGMAAGCPWRQLRPARAAIVLPFSAGIIAVTVCLAPERTIDRMTSTFGPEDDGGNLRLWFWDGAVRMFRAAPVAGVGLGNYAYWSPYYQGKALDAPGGERYAHNGLHTTDAHCEPVQLLAETGLAGFACCAWMFARLLRRRGAEWGGLAALLAFAFFNAGFHSAPHALAALLLACIMLARGRYTRLHERDSGALAMTVFTLAAALFAATCWTGTLPSWRLAAAENVHVRGGDSVKLYEHVLAHPWPNPEAREEYGMALWENGAAKEAHIQFLLAMEGLDTARLHLQLGRSAVELGDLDGAVRAFEACLWRWPSNAEAWQWLYALTTPERRTALEEHARRWRIPVAAAGPGSI